MILTWVFCIIQTFFLSLSSKCIGTHGVSLEYFRTITTTREKCLHVSHQSWPPLQIVPEDQQLTRQWACIFHSIHFTIGHKYETSTDVLAQIFKVKCVCVCKVNVNKGAVRSVLQFVFIIFLAKEKLTFVGFCKTYQKIWWESFWLNLVLRPWAKNWVTFFF